MLMVLVGSTPRSSICMRANLLHLAIAACGEHDLLLRSAEVIVNVVRAEQAACRPFSQQFLRAGRLRNYSLAKRAQRTKSGEHSKACSGVHLPGHHRRVGS